MNEEYIVKSNHVSKQEIGDRVEITVKAVKPMCNYVIDLDSEDVLMDMIKRFPYRIFQSKHASISPIELEQGNRYRYCLAICFDWDKRKNNADIPQMTILLGKENEELINSIFTQLDGQAYAYEIINDNKANLDVGYGI